MFREVSCNVITMQLLQNLNYLLALALFEYMYKTFLDAIAILSRFGCHEVCKIFFSKLISEGFGSLNSSLFS